MFEFYVFRMKTVMPNEKMKDQHFIICNTTELALGVGESDLRLLLPITFKGDRSIVKTHRKDRESRDRRDRLLFKL